MNNKNRIGKILIVDDDSSVIASIELLLKQNGYQTLSACNPHDALQRLEQEDITLIIQDMNFSRNTSGKEGLQLLREIKSKYNKLPVLLMTAWASIELAVEGIKQGASDFLTKPWDNKHLLRLIETSIELNQPIISQPIDRNLINQQFNFENIIGDDPHLLEILTTIGRVAPTDASILILGESGTGKELIANAIHNNSARKEQPHIKVNLGGMTTSLFESEMFGHVKGAFTDAKQDRLGRFELANNGSIFLDEVGDLDPASQVKLLRILQDQTFQPVGSSKTRRSNFRVISATNRSLDKMVASGDFREDLLYRLNLITIELPPLRKRKGDILLLANYHLRRVEKLYGLKSLVLEGSAVRWLETQSWPGNIRQLAQTIERVVLMNSTTLFSAEHFIGIASSHQTQNKGNKNADGISDIENLTLDEIEKIMIIRALNAYRKNITKVAEALGVSRAALYRRIEKYGINL